MLGTVPMRMRKKLYKVMNEQGGRWDLRHL